MFRYATRLPPRLGAPYKTRALITTKMTTHDAKKDHRKEIKSALARLTPEEIATESRKAQDLILSLPQYQRAKNLSIYLSMPPPRAEAQTHAILTDALSEGKKVFIPYIHQPPTGPKIIDMLRLTSVAEFEGLERDAWGIPSLSADSVAGRENAMGGSGLGTGEAPEATADGEGRKGEEGTLDLMVMPGVAFDRGLNRLGHGRGFYDAYLSRFCADGTGKPFLVGLCLKEQLLPGGQDIPTTDSDWIVDAVAVGDGTLLTLED